MPVWVLNLTAFPAFNLGFSVFLWISFMFIPIFAMVALIKRA